MKPTRIAVLVAAVAIGVVWGISHSRRSWVKLGREDGPGRATWALQRDSIADLGDGVYGVRIRVTYNDPQPIGWLDVAAEQSSDALWSVMADSIAQLDGGFYGVRVKRDQPGMTLSARGVEFDYEIAPVEIGCRGHEYRAGESDLHGSDGELVSVSQETFSGVAETGTSIRAVVDAVCRMVRLREEQVGDSTAWNSAFSHDYRITRFQINCGERTYRVGNSRWYRSPDTLVFFEDDTVFSQWEGIVDGTMGELTVDRVCELID